MANYENVPIFVKTFLFLELYVYKEIEMQHLEIVCNEKQDIYLIQWQAENANHLRTG
jgi:hypothetical protein